MNDSEKMAITLPMIEPEISGYSDLNQSLHHLISSVIFISKSLKIEQDYKNKEINVNIENEYRSYIAGSIFSTIASLEATINEFLIEAKGNNEPFYSNLKKLIENWEIIEHKSLIKILEKGAILDKYQLALRSYGKNELCRGREPYQNIKNFIELRNKLVHYKLESFDASSISDGLEKKLTGKFKLNPFANINSRFFPFKCLSYGCIEWGLYSCEKFIENFYFTIGMPDFSKIRRNLHERIITNK